MKPLNHNLTCSYFNTYLTIFYHYQWSNFLMYLWQCSPTENLLLLTHIHRNLGVKFWKSTDVFWLLRSLFNTTIFNDVLSLGRGFCYVWKHWWQSFFRTFSALLWHYFQFFQVIPTKKNCRNIFNFQQKQACFLPGLFSSADSMSDYIAVMVGW